MAVNIKNTDIAKTLIIEMYFLDLVNLFVNTF